MRTERNSFRRRILGVEIEAHPVVFPASAALVILAVIVAACFPGRTLIGFDWLQEEIARKFGWLYLASMTGFTLFALCLGFGRFGHVRLGADDEQPEFSTPTWLAMLFSAGMGIGMLFYGVAEPTWHYLAPPEIAPESLAAARNAMGITLFHWCLHPWALYALVAVSLAYFSFRRGLPLSFRSVFYPLLGDRIKGRIGDAIDILAVLATLFGLATSLGLGAKQVNAGLAHVFGIPQSTGVQLMLIAGITAAAVVSLVSGLHAGVRRLSEINMILAAALLLFVFIAGPTVYLLGALVDNVGAYAQRLAYGSFWTGRYSDPDKVRWLANWTVFYWGWWIAWSPFVGMFIARISRGRTIREFILGVLFVPSALAAIWMTGFGSTALHQITRGLRVGDAEVANVNGTDYPVQVIDEESGLPRQQNGDWLVGPHAKNVATPRGILMQMSDQQLVTKSGASVEYLRGVLVERDTVRPYRPTDEERFDGTFESRIETLDLAGFLTRPVLSPDRTRRVDTTSTAMFVMLSAYPLATLTTLLGTLTIILFFITSSDSASLVADIIASGGNQNPTTGTRLFWGILEGLLASSLLLAGGLKGLQTGAITIGLPFCLLVILMCFSLYRGLRDEAELATELAATDTADEASQA